ncbi:MULTISPECIES: hypothetical protein [Bifidobacterium]|uniref:Uncharacterized protein n=1 Tax=Bifidobacterium biavatii DSM 23969 TaxID=1437608 RepID=A0A086ZW56_9BIFI|nr:MULTISPECIES: hypothetical protein [Bifidobacterium]KFI50756.1 hypothetical protein BBIA_1549 [Bifidobacterium biavatii DSM 23969]
MVKLVDLYTVDKDSAECDYLRLCDAPLPQDVLEFLGKSSEAEPGAVPSPREQVYA